MPAPVLPVTTAVEASVIVVSPLVASLSIPMVPPVTILALIATVPTLF